MPKVAYRVLSPLKRDGQIIPVGGPVIFDAEDEEQAELVALGVIDGQSGIVVEEGQQESGPPASSSPVAQAKPRGGKAATGKTGGAS